MNLNKDKLFEIISNEYQNKPLTEEYKMFLDILNTKEKKFISGLSEHNKSQYSEIEELTNNLIMIVKNDILKFCINFLFE